MRADRAAAAPSAPAAQAVVDRPDEPAQLVDAVRGGDFERVVARLAAVAHPDRQRALERVGAQRARLALVEHGERRVQAGGDGVRPQHPHAEAVDRRDPGGLGLLREPALAELEEARAHALAQLARRLLGERDREDRRRVDPSSSTERTNRSVSTRVLPEPALAVTISALVAARDRAFLLGGEVAAQGLTHSPRWVARSRPRAAADRGIAAPVPLPAAGLGPWLQPAGTDLAHGLQRGGLDRGQQLLHLLGGHAVALDSATSSSTPSTRKPRGRASSPPICWYRPPTTSSPSSSCAART